MAATSPSLALVCRTTGTLSRPSSRTTPRRPPPPHAYLPRAIPTPIHARNLPNAIQRRPPLNPPPPPPPRPERPLRAL